MKRTIIILTGGPASGKTTLANLLTCNGMAGVVLDDGGRNCTPAFIRQFLACPCVVICGERGNDVRTDPKFAELLDGAELLCGPEVLIWKLELGDSSPIIPAAALADPTKFRVWLLDHGGVFSGGVRELRELRRRLPVGASLRELFQLGQALKLRCLGEGPR